jgi:hypothetical protein
MLCTNKRVAGGFEITPIEDSRRANIEWWETPPSARLLPCSWRRPSTKRSMPQIVLLGLYQFNSLPFHCRFGQSFLLPRLFLRVEMRMTA